MRYFEWFGLPVAFPPDATLLRERFLAKSRACHPDRFTLAPQKEKDKALQDSALNNEAYRVLSHPEHCIGYLLEEWGLLNEENDALPPDFLGEIMEIHDLVLESKVDPEAARLLKSAMQSLSDSLHGDFERCTGLQPLTRDTAGPLKTYYLKFKYFLRIKESLPTFTDP